MWIERKRSQLNTSVIYETKSVVLPKNTSYDGGLNETTNPKNHDVFMLLEESDRTGNKINSKWFHFNGITVNPRDKTLNATQIQLRKPVFDGVRLVVAISLNNDKQEIVKRVYSRADIDVRHHVQYSIIATMECKVTSKIPYKGNKFQYSNIYI